MADVVLVSGCVNEEIVMNWLNPLDKPRRSKADFPVTVAVTEVRRYRRTCQGGLGLGLGPGLVLVMEHWTSMCKAPNIL